MGACKGIEDVLTWLGEQPDEPQECLLGLLAVVERLLVSITPETWGWHGEGQVVVLWHKSIEPDLLDGAKSNVSKLLNSH